MRTCVYLILLAFEFSSSSFGQNKNSIPVDVKYNRTYVTVQIGKYVIPYILLDTGFSFDGLMLFNSSYRDSLDITRAVEVRVGGAGSGEAPKALMIDSLIFSIGNVKMVNQPVIIMQGNIDMGSNGIIGYSIFGHYLTEFDYDKNTMTLNNSDDIQTDSTWTAIPMYFKNNNIPWIDASVKIESEEPVQLSMYIDFAAGDEIVLLDKPGMKFTIPKETKEVYIGRGLSGDIYGKSGIISKLIIGPYELNNLKASFTDAKIRSKQDNADAIIGNASLRKFNLIFDYSNKKLYLKPNLNFKDALRLPE
jgi:hypothetical protein